MNPVNKISYEYLCKSHNKHLTTGFRDDQS